MKRLVLLGEGQGDVQALPVLVRRLVEAGPAPAPLFVDSQVIRDLPGRLVHWDRQRGQANYEEWLKRVRLASRRRDTAGVLAVYDGDLRHFPAGSGRIFCAGGVAAGMAQAARAAGAGEWFSLAVVFACVEFETWLVAGVESLAGKRLADGRVPVPAGVCFPGGDVEAHGKRWLEAHCPGYRPVRDQQALTELLDPQRVRERNLRSFRRLEHALAQLLEAATCGVHLATPC